MPVSSIDASLTRLFDAPGVTDAALVDAVTGLTYATAGRDHGAAAAAECADLAALIGDRLAAAGADGELESVVVTLRDQHLVLRTVPRQGDPLLLTAVADRERTNLALVLHRLGALAEGVLA
ncbi:hypothetical protein ACIQU5_08135 [Streptomyces sp. NPDC090306]|uniref:hypothetical protein n=1 Tax=Streptomyces sp. NPDC090306 TaxID=3365961 RepID=UPI003812A01D